MGGAIGLADNSMVGVDEGFGAREGLLEDGLDTK